MEIVRSLRRNEKGEEGRRTGDSSKKTSWKEEQGKQETRERRPCEDTRGTKRERAEPAGHLDDIQLQERRLVKTAGDAHFPGVLDV